MCKRTVTAGTAPLVWRKPDWSVGVLPESRDIMPPRCCSCSSTVPLLYYVLLLQCVLWLGFRCYILRTSGMSVYRKLTHACGLRVFIALNETSPVLALMCCRFQCTGPAQARALAPLLAWHQLLPATFDAPIYVPRQDSLLASTKHQSL